MPKLIAFTAASALLVLTILPAAATVTKTWVSSTGTDSGTCQLVAPCKTFQFAHDQTTAGGEIDVKDTGSYGPLVITKAISVVSGDGALAAVGAPADGAGIAITAGAQDKVILEGLFVDGHGTGAYGIQFKSGYSLTIQNCHIRNVSSTAIALEPLGSTFYTISNTEIAEAKGDGIAIQPFNKFAVGSISGSFFHDNNVGLFVGYSNTSVTNSVITANQIGIETENGGNVMLGQSTVSENATFGIETLGGVVQSYGDNYINANGTDVSGSFSSLSRR